MKLATVIIPELDEGTQLNDTLDSLLDTSDSSLYDIIVVSDGSKVELDLTKYGKSVLHYKKKKREGVGAAFDSGAALTDNPNLIIMGSDIRFLDNGYMDKMIDRLEEKENEKSIICTGVKGINPGNMDIHRDSKVSYGAKILMFMKAEDLPSRGSVMNQLRTDNAVATFRNILEAKWINKQEEEFYEIPCVLGAFYGVRTKWYKWIRGFEGHRRWGTLEPFISLKSWLAGGSCKIDTSSIICHIYKQEPSHKTYGHDLMYNKIALSKILFGKDADKFIKFLGSNSDIEIAKMMVGEDSFKIDNLADSFEQIRERDMNWFNDKFPFKYSELICE